MGYYEIASFGSLIVLNVLGIGFTAWHLFKSSGRGVASMLVEKDGPNAGDVSFARVSGALGALTLASLFVTNVFWVNSELYGDGDLSNILQVWPIYAFGTALFAPYAFNRLSRIGGVSIAAQSDEI